MDRAQVEETLSELIADIKADRAALAEDGELQLENVGQRVNDVCTAAVNLPKEDAVAVQDMLQELKTCLSALSNDLEQAVGSDQPEEAAADTEETPAQTADPDPKQD
ncbi:MAG: hypothetical protein RIM72_19355 [Alphaproteobacteria bacterium]